MTNRGWAEALHRLCERNTPRRAPDERAPDRRWAEALHRLCERNMPESAPVDDDEKDIP